ncbi:MAG TPA: DEAD/DEAH box helicase [Streptosporangiaceae bacterium]|nr:DEAD/DEAH box helicase [Streptosporangiaceae bacterium]
MAAPPVPPVRYDLLTGLRGWQQDAYHEYFRLPRRDFLLVATPGAGKTTYALTVAAELLARREVMFLTIVTPTEHLKHQWAAAAARFGIAIDSAYRNAQGRAGADFAGVAVTYAQVAAHPALHRQRTENRRTLVIFDEIHHAGDAMSWGDAVKEAFDPARRRLALTGTPFRSDANPIPFVTYIDEPGGSKRSSSDYVYGYGPALENGVVRPVIFLAYSGEMHWRTRAGDEITATLGTPMTKDQIAQAWRTALDPAGEWVSRVLEAADKRLTEVRRGMPDAGGLVIAGDHEDARAYAALLRGLTGKRPVVVLSDDKAASRKISAFADSDDRWMVAVRMVSEGVDIPRLAVGVYATSVSTALFFAQAVGRFVRARRRGETASVFLPSVPVLLSYAAELEAERDHVLRAPGSGESEEEDLLAEAQRERSTPDTFDEPAFTALNASAHFDRVLYDGGEFGTATAAGSPEEEDFLGLPGLLDPDQVRTLLRKRQEAQLAARSKAASPPVTSPKTADLKAAAFAPGSPVTAASRISEVPMASGASASAGASTAPSAGASASASASAGAAAPAAPPVSRQALAALRKELNGLVGAWSHRTNQPHGVIHNNLRQACGGPPLPQATADQIQARIDQIRRWAVSGR